MKWHLFLDDIPQLLAGVLLTLDLLAGALSLGVLLGTGLCYVRVARVPVVHRIAVVYVPLFRDTPLLVSLFAIYFGLSQFEAVRESIV